ncbi:MAG TPA: MarR family transcriptional regulator [Bryobacteraceae bacterium]|jgi:DNA-binding MarR family transcriptional regulator|nr:MarR family transcriptional regulator [Bryobacteraceae bacterium]
MAENAVRQVMELYPRIYFACHTRHVRDPQTRRLLSAHQASILDHLDEHEPLALLDLAHHMGVTPSTMSLNIERLVRRGYVSRERSAQDGRRLKLRITPGGVRLREAKSVLDPARVRALLARLSPAQREAGIHGLALLARAGSEQMEAQSKRKKKGRGRLPS